LTGQRGEKGSLTFSIPKTATFYGVDPQDGREGSGGGPILYKEIRMEGTVSGDGIFTKGIVPGTRYRLVLQGRGNNCMAKEEFKNWNLQVKGRRAEFSFYGMIAQ
jgi:hypothetical protein